MYPIPSNYQITFEPDLKNFSYKAKQVITFAVAQKTSMIAFDAVDLQIMYAELLDDVSVISFNTDKNEGKVYIEFSSKLSTEKIYKLSIGFEAEINEGLAGFYRAKYNDNGQEKYIATSQFEAADARRAFPCVDHPSYKATFDITFIIDPNLTAISNTVAVQDEIIAEKKQVRFATTPLMSTYLLYLGVGEFEYQEDKYKDILIRGVTTPGKKQYTDFAIDCTRKFLSYFEEYFGFPYPLQKIDLIAIPDFAAGAMENWGAITFRETALLFYPGKTAVKEKSRIAEVVAHELAHQWFGNLVTMLWWNDLWLNESFATFMAYKAVDHFYPEWDMWTEYIQSTVFEGMKLDSLVSSHPIQMEVKKISEINELFDEIAYDKGGSILRMLEAYLGADNFRNGLREYIKKFQYNNAEGADLWSTLEQSSEVPIAALMNSFISQTGFPLLTVATDEDDVYIKQERYLNYDIDDGQQWFVPLLFTDGKNDLRKALEREGAKFNKDSLNFAFINKDYTGFFITNYSEEALKILGENFVSLNIKTKLGLVHDLCKLAHSRKIPLSTFTDFLKDYVTKEKESSILLFIIENLLTFNYLVENDDVESLLKDFSTKAVDYIKLEPSVKDDPTRTKLRNIAIFSLLLLEDEDVLEFCKSKFAKFLKDEKSLHADIRGIVYKAAVWSNPKNYDVILDLYKKSNIPDEKLKFLSALGNSKDEKQIEQALDFALSDDVRFANIFYVIFVLTQNPFAQDQTLEWLINNWSKLLEKSGGMASLILRRILKFIIPSCGVNHFDEVMNFIDVNRSDELNKTFDQVSEELEINQRFVRVNG